MAAALSLVVQHVGLGSCPGCPTRAHPDPWVANNPFRMFPGNVMATIRAMKKGPTPSATAIHDAGLSFQRQEDGGLEVQGRGGYFVVAAASMRMDDMRVGAYVTNLLVFSPGRDTRLNPELGVVRTKTWIRLRARHSFEDALDYMQTLANDHPGFFF